MAVLEQPGMEPCLAGRDGYALMGIWGNWKGGRGIFDQDNVSGLGNSAWQSFV